MTFAAAASPLLVTGILLLWPSEGASEPRDPAADPSLAVDAGEWIVVRPEGETGCAFQTPFQFFYREGPNPSKLLVYFQGGGACWNWVSCSGMFDTTVADDEMSEFRGIFDFNNAENPFQEYSILFVPYCTGDVHVGDTVARYGGASWNAPAVEHRGFRNVMAVLAWAKAHVPPPTRLVIAGASAGSYGALFHAPNAKDTFPAAELIVIGDSGVPLLHEYPRILGQWGADRRLRHLDESRRGDDGAPITLETAHEHLAKRYPDAVLAQITTDQDAIQRAFYIVSGSGDWRGATLRLLASLERRVPAFRAFVVSGTDHGLMRTDRFYAYEENGVRLRDWIEDVVNGHPVSSQYCRGCDGTEE